MSLFFPLCFYGQTDSLFIDRPSNFMITPNFLVQNLDLTINGTHGSIVSYEPGKTAAIGATLSYKWFVGSLYYSVYNEFNSGLEEKSKYFDFRFNFSRRRGALDLYFQFYKGFSVKELPKSNDGNLLELANPNLDLFSGGANFYYSLNPKHSVQSVYKYNELQSRSSGSLLAGVSQNYTQISFTNSIFPDDIVDDLQILGEENDGKFIAVIPTIGYQYNFIKNKFNISPTAFGGLGIQYQDYESAAKGDFQGFNRSVKYGFNLPVGINNPNNYYGIVTRYEKSIFYLERGIDIENEQYSIKAYLGIRF
ncbi:MAG: DUF4421 family protein [Vicingaceae bacterium]|nr:DUF4421 family protein [Vicingaceae bacterium]